jgi:transcriptional regulator with XRE-family HTH domain
MGRAKSWRVEKLPQKLLKIRESLDLTQDEIVIKLGLRDKIYRNHISEYETGKRQPPMPVVLAYSKFIGVCCDYLIDDSLDLPEKLPSKLKHR